MRLHTTLDNRKSRSTALNRPAKRRPARQRAGDRLSLEALEVRCLLTFDAAVNYGIAAFPLDAAVADFNGDAQLDIAAINSGSLSINLGNGDGTFQAAQTTAIGSGLRSVAAGDLNADGKLDLVATSSVWRCIEYGEVWGYYGSYWTCINSVTEGFVKVLVGNGNGTFQSAGDFIIASNSNPASVVLGDFNADGTLDAATSSTGNVVSVLLGNGDGTLQDARNSIVDSNPRSVAVGDLNSDGKLDLVTANQWPGVSVLDGNGDGTFQPSRTTAVSQTTHAVAVGDLNADGKLDVAVTSSAVTCTYYGWYGCYGTVTDGYVNVLLGNGTGTFAPIKTTWANNAQPVDLALGDFNADGKLDVATADQMQQAFDPTVLLGKGDGTFDTPYNFDSAAGPVSIAVADFDGDAAPDLAVANTYASNVSILLNDSNWPPLGAPIAAISDVSVTEGNTGTTAAVFTVSLSAGFGEPISIEYSTADGTATAGSDYQATTGTLTFNPGGPLSQSISVLVDGERLAEPIWSEQFFVNLRNGINVRIGDGLGTGSIVDDEPAVTVSNSQVTEGHTGTTAAVFTVTLAAASDGPVSVHWSTSDGTATAGDDFQATTGTLTFNTGAPISQTVTVPVNGDRLGEYSFEYFYVTLGNGNTGMGTIVDDEPYASISDATVIEGNTGTRTAEFTVSLSAAYDEPVTVNFSTVEGDTEAWTWCDYYGYCTYPPPAATAGSDFDAQSGRVTFDRNETSKTVRVVVRGDRLVEDTEAFSVNLTPESANASIGDGHGLGSIADDEPLVSIDYSTTVTEGNSGTTAAVFTVRLAAPYDEPVTVSFATSGGTATDGSDFVVTTGSVTFAPNDTMKTFAVAVIGDLLVETSEYFYVNLTGSTQGRIVNGYATATILDDDRPPSIRIGNASVVEGHSGTKLMVFTVTLSAPSGRDVWVNFATANGTAKVSDNDYVATSGTLHFAPGQTTATISVVIKGDQKGERNENFYVNLSGASNAVIADSRGVGTILDDDRNR
jgi:hypothetical protein